MFTILYTTVHIFVLFVLLVQRLNRSWKSMKDSFRRELQAKEKKLGVGQGHQLDADTCTGSSSSFFFL